MIGRLKTLLISALLIYQTILAGATGESMALEQVLHRSALIVGSNAGAENREQLRYAITDAQTFARVLKSLGGISPNSCILIQNPSVSALKKAMLELKNIATAADKQNGRKEIIFYYSGHADERGFLLGNEVFNYSELKTELNKIPAEIRIAVVDACASGNLTRQKGGIKRPPFIYDSSSKMEGHAYLTSSSDNEAAVESDRIKGSYFTHSLISGLRGAADFNSDGKVTLNEAYQFTFNETLKKTEKTISGPQHAGYDIRLKGSGDLVLTDLRTGSSGLIIAEDILGTIFVRNKSGDLIIEFNKQFSKQVSLSLEPGYYKLTIEQEHGVFTSTVELHDNNVSSITLSDLQKFEKTAGTPRGIGDKKIYRIDYERHVPIVFSVIPPLSTSGPNLNFKTEFLTGLLVGAAGQVNGCAVSSLVNLVADDARGVVVSGISNITGKKLTGVSISGIVEYCGSGYGIQISGCTNIALKDKFEGAQINGGINLAKLITGVQIAGVANYATRNTGFQCAGVCNVSAGMDIGLQVGGAINANKTSSLHGAQLAGVANVQGKNLNGTQISGVINVAEGVHGAQISTVNIARNVKGLQLGLINICDDIQGIPIGLLSIVRKNPPRPQVWIDEIGFVNTGIRTGSKYSYSYLGIGAKHRNGRNYWTPLYGIGFRVPFKKTFIGIDWIGKHINDGLNWTYNDYSHHSALRVIAGYKIFEHLTVWGGPTVNGIVCDKQPDIPMPSWSKRYSKYVIGWNGFVAGAEF